MKSIIYFIKYIRILQINGNIYDNFYIQIMNVQTII